jgi:hypothetical protein
LTQGIYSYDYLADAVLALITDLALKYAIKETTRAGKPIMLVSAGVPDPRAWPGQKVIKRLRTPSTIAAFTVMLALIAIQKYVT